MQLTESDLRRLGELFEALEPFNVNRLRVQRITVCTGSARVTLSRGRSRFNALTIVKVEEDKT